MKNIILTVMALGAVLTASAEQYFSIVNTVGYAKDTSPSDAHASYYSGYLCTVESAADLFGGKTAAADLTSYISENYAEVLEDLGSEVGHGSVFALGTDGEGYSFGQYAVSTYTADPLAGNYLAILLYADGQNEAFRAYGAGSSSAIGGGMTFDDNGMSAATATVGSWTAVPEPTGGLLLLLGLAGLAVKRKRA